MEALLISPAVQIILIAIGIMLLVAGVTYLLRHIFRIMVEKSYSSIILTVYATASEGILTALDFAIDTTDPSGHDAEIEQTAKNVYATLPDAIWLKVKGNAIPIPIKLILTEAAFVLFVLGIYHNVDNVHEDLQQHIDTELIWWHAVNTKTLVKPN